ncbi:chitin synthase-domain-containing protein [Radiomyces spectabilis]|uniref:chitin synthase-domain-containing protein n=1 Tax=Radiomyces spectabilis TaxID=64574 RepID=UPI00221E98EC|nr:chitin synthase-domain-containing protein [Radiomyces spectabilis]KAI8380967.1 chitin synthase-domain-containing protein [Radiomyces spectabilis]
MTPAPHDAPPTGGAMPIHQNSYSSSVDTHYYNGNGVSVGRKPTTLGRAPTRRIAPGANSIANASHNIQRGRTLIRPDRYQEPPPLLTGKQATSRSLFDPWVLISRIVTFWAFPPMLRAMGKTDAGMQQAWREKITLCFIIACMGGFVAFITIGLSSVMCPPDQSNNQQMYASYNDTINSASLLGIAGWQFNISETETLGHINLFDLIPGTDITNHFQHGANLAACQDTGNTVANQFAAVTFNPCVPNNGYQGCSLGPLNQATMNQLNLKNSTRLVGFDWTQLASSNLTNFFVIDGSVLNMDPYINAHPVPIPNDPLDTLIREILNQTFAEGGRDGTKNFFRRSELRASINCMVQKYRAGHIDKATPGCFTASIVLFCSLFIVLAIVLARFFMALIFSWFLSRKLSRTPPPAPRSASVMNQTMEMSDIRKPQRMDSGSTLGTQKTLVEVGNDLYTVMLITCYSENTEGIRATVESLSATEYPDDRKLLFLIADGIITGSGETRSTPDMCLDLITFDNPEMKLAEAKSYIAVAAGAKQHNCAKVYAGHYVCKGHKVPMILVVKCGAPEEEGKPKPGNRGKRDSQLILMNFFSRVTYNDRMTPLDYELFQKIHYLMGVTPDMFELVLMVDADTKVYASSLRLLVNCMVNDNLIMGLCGETKIANKRGSWVTAIQVYEYFISHHLAKGFEAVFGGVTCLPGCFSMYRLKARKGDGDWVPIITKPEIVQEYSQNTVTTLHQKNLLLLGEDRFLTTLMLRNFPYRKMVFTPQAICKTIVPDEFKVLLSQRRRWINSTIHNLFELVLVRNLCGTFCFSMQFVVMMDLIGTLTLPVAIVLTVVLVANMAATKITSFTMAVPLILLIIVLFSPAFLILITTRKWVYLMWMLVYLCALPIWNFVLPVYSFWHFDDFSWGETRKVTGEVKGEDHGKKDGEFDPSKVPLKRWEDYERKRVRAVKRRERKLRELGPTHLTHSIVAEEDDSRRGLLADPPMMDSDSASNLSYDTRSEHQQPMHYFDPSKEAPGKASSGYYPSYRPQSQPHHPPPMHAPPMHAPPMHPQPMQPHVMSNQHPTPRMQPLPQPHAAAPGPWGPQGGQNFGPKQLHHPQQRRPAQPSQPSQPYYNARPPMPPPK